ncbi:MAG: hypothetical protein PHC92_04010 [Syntrophomonadaceae bacterium]|nr:hypothetical protein [Syntrophomonadaceae bacterium]
MNYISRIKDNILEHKQLWTVVWPLVILNIFTYVYLSHGLSLIMLIFFLLMALLGIGGIKLLAIQNSYDISIPEEFTGKAAELMKEIKNYGEVIFDDEIEQITEPVRGNVRKDFARGLAWLWEDNQEFVGRVDQFLKEAIPISASIDPVNEDRAKLLRLINKDLDILSTLVDGLKGNKERDFLDLDDLIDSKVSSMKNAMRTEQDIFYDYVYKIMIAQMNNNEEKDGEGLDVAEYFNINKLGEQLSTNLIKSLETRILPLQDSIIKELESFSADVVGKMQNSALQMMNTFKELKDILLRLLDECKGEDSEVLKKLNQTLVKVDMLQEQAEEMMLTLAWQDILVEKRWQDIQEKVFMIREKVNDNVDEDVLVYINSLLTEEIPGFSQMNRNNENAVFSKSLIDAELVFQIYSGGKLSEIIKNGVYSLFQFMRPLELLVKKNVRLREEGILKRKSLNLRVRSEEYQTEFNKVKEIVEMQNPKLLVYLENVYPKNFYAFCNNPYIKQKPEDLNQAAWILFLDILERGADETMYFLVGVLLLIHQMRNKYIHPFKPLPLDIESDEEIELIRYAAYQAVEIMLSIDYKALSA